MHKRKPSPASNTLRTFTALLANADEPTRTEMRRLLNGASAMDEAPRVEAVPPKASRRQRRLKPRAGVEAEWGRVFPDCTTISGFSEAHLWRAILDGCFVTIKAGDKPNSRRLVNLPSFRAWLRDGARWPEPAAK